MKRNKLVNVLFALMLSASIVGCGEQETNTGYDGREFNISVAQDNSVKASIKKVGTNFELTISGAGEALSYDKKELVPWNAISKKINKVEIKDGITNIGDYYFYSTTISDYYIPSSVKSVGTNSFNAAAKVYSYSQEGFEFTCENDIYFYSDTKPSVNGEYWHMVGTTPVVWDLYKIMFIGNSFTFFPSDLFSVENPAVCALTKEIASTVGVELEMDFVVKGAHTLKKFANEKDEMGSIVDEKLKAASDYDYIVLQEHSTNPVNDYKSFSAGAESLVNKIKSTQTNCQVYLYATWGFPSAVSETSIFSSVSKMEELIRNAYHQCGEELSVPVSDIGEAFTYVYENYPNISLYGSDDKHQSYAGAYLSSLVHVANMFNVDVREATFNGILDEATAKTLKETAYKVVFE